MTARWLDRLRGLIRRACLPLRRRAPADGAAPPGPRLHLGCGERYLEGYVNIDYPPSAQTVMAPRADVHADIRELCYPPESVAEVRLEHVLEHFARPLALALLMEWYAWLKEGGKLVIETPDFERCARRAASRLCPLRERMVLLRHIFGSHEAFWAVHADGWDARRLRHVLGRLGFRDVRSSRSEWKGTYNVRVDAFKRRPFLRAEEQEQAAADILEMSLVDDSASERKLLEVWKRDLAAARLACRQAGVGGRGAPR